MASQASILCVVEDLLFGSRRRIPELSVLKNSRHLQHTLCSLQEGSRGGASRFVSGAFSRTCRGADGVLLF